MEPEHKDDVHQHPQAPVSPKSVEHRLSDRLLMQVQPASAPANGPPREVPARQRVPTDQELEDLLAKEAPPIVTDSNNFLLGQKIFPMTLQDFYSSFLSKTAPFNFVEYYKTKPGNKDIKLSEGLSTFAEDTGPSTDERYNVDLTMAITGVPFCSKSRFIKDTSINRAKK